MILKSTENVEHLKYQLDLVSSPRGESLPRGESHHPEERATLLADADERLRLFHKMVESIMSLKEEEERARQALEPG